MMAHSIDTRRETRRLALQMLYQFDARGDDDPAAIEESLREASHDPKGRFEGPWAVHSPVDSECHRQAFATARAAWGMHEEADRLASELAPSWPTSRQPVMDRNVIRLCWYEMIGAGVPLKVAVNEAIELAKEFGTARSAAFLNGVLDRLLRVAQRRRGEEIEPGAMAPLPGDSDLDASSTAGAHSVEESSTTTRQTEFWSSDQ